MGSGKDGARDKGPEAALLALLVLTFAAASQLVVEHHHHAAGHHAHVHVAPGHGEPATPASSPHRHRSFDILPVAIVDAAPTGSSHTRAAWVTAHGSEHSHFYDPYQPTARHRTAAPSLSGPATRAPAPLQVAVPWTGPARPLARGPPRATRPFRI